MPLRPGLRSGVDVGLPQLLVAPIGDVGAQQIGSLGQGGPVVEGGVDFDFEAEPGRATVLRQARLEAPGGALVLLQDAADLPVDLPAIEALLGTGDAGRQAFERRFDPLAELIVHGLLFAAPISRAHRITVSPVSGQRASLTSMPARTSRQPAGAASASANFFSSDFGAPMM